MRTCNVLSRWTLGALALLTAGWVAAQLATTESPDWKEADAPPPPAFQVERLLRFDAPTNSTMTFGVDPNTLDIGKDCVVRYVVMAVSPSGVVNAMYEGIRCGTGEFKTYARHNPASGWSKVDNPEWRSLFDIRPSRHSLWLAKQGVCDNAAPASSRAEIVRALKSNNAPRSVY